MHPLPNSSIFPSDSLYVLVSCARYLIFHLIEKKWLTSDGPTVIFILFISSREVLSFFVFLCFLIRAVCSSVHFCVRTFICFHACTSFSLLACLSICLLFSLVYTSGYYG